MKKKVLSIALVVALVAIIAGGSLAYFTSRDTAQNTFAMPGGGDQDPVDVTVNETFVPGEGYTAVAGENGITYTGVLPTMTVSKIPSVENTGASEEYIKIVITLDTKWKTIYTAHGETLSTALLDGLNVGAGANQWTAFAADTSAADGVFAFTYNSAVAAGAETTPIFTGVNFAKFIGTTDLDTIGDSLSMDIVGYGVQSFGFASAAEAFADAQVIADLAATAAPIIP